MSNFLIDEDTDLLAAEFVLGTLDSEERANAQSLLRMDHGFIAMVRIWERRFGELHLMVEPVEPDAKIFQRIKAKIAEIAPSEPTPEGKPPADMTASPAGPEPAASPANAEMPKPLDGLAAGNAAQPQEASPDGTTPPPAEVSATGETEKPAETLPVPEAAAAAVVPSTAEEGQIGPEGRIGPERQIGPEGQIGPEPKPPETVAKSESGPVPKVAIPAPPPLPPPPLDLSEKPQSRRPEISIDVIRSRGRWRVVGVGMTLLVMSLVALLVAWRFVPDRLPFRLRPAQLMMSIGIRGLPNAAPAVKPEPPVAQFDE
jgi:hypothetical protein